MKAQWLRKPIGTESGAVVFVHGINSSGDTCWLHKNGTYWPELLKNENEFNAVGIYVFTYETDFFSGNYNLSDVVERSHQDTRL